METQDRLAAADSLLAAYDGEVVAPLSETYPDIDVEDAYAIQRLQLERWTSGGRTVRGHKVGLTSRVMQRQLGVDQPDYGQLLDTMILGDGAELDAGAFLQPKIEPEIAFVLGRDLAGPGVSVVDAVRAVEFVLPALEVIDSRIAGWRIGLADTIADNASSGAVVLGTRPVTLGEIDLRLTGCVLTVDGQVAATGAGGAVLGNPVNALVWLANTVGPLGTTLRAGQVVIPGSLTAAQPIRAGGAVSATFAGLGTVSTRMGAA